MTDFPNPAGRVFLDDRTWAQLDGKDLCPRCVTPAEDRQLALSYIQLVEQEIGRVEREERDLTPHESALVAFALALRARLDHADDQQLPPPPPADR